MKKGGANVTGYKVGIELSIHGNFERKLRELIQRVAALDNRVKMLQSSFRRLNGTLTGFGSGVSRTSRLFVRDFDSMRNKVGGLTAELNKARHAMRSLSSGPPNRGGPPGEGGMDPILGAAGGYALGKSGLPIGRLGLMAAGYYAYRGAKGAVESASELQNRSLQVDLMNLPKSDRSNLKAAILSTTESVRGTTLAGNTELARDLVTILGAGRIKEVTALLPGFARYQSTYQKIYGESSGRMMNDTMRYLENIPGVLQDMRIFTRELNSLWKTRALGSRVNPSEYFKAMQTGKLALAMTSEGFRYGAFSSMMTGTKGTTLGTQLMSTFYALGGGHVQKGTATWLQHLGLTTNVTAEGKNIRDVLNKRVDPSIRELFTSEGMGSAMGMQIRGLKTFMRNPYEWSKKYIVPAIMKEHGWKNLDKHRKEVAEEEARYLWRNVSGFLGQMVIRQPAIERDIALQKRLAGLGQSTEKANRTFQGAVLNFQASVKNFGSAMGGHVIKAVTAATNKVADVLGGSITPSKIPPTSGLNALVPSSTHNNPSKSADEISDYLKRGMAASALHKSDITITIHDKTTGGIHAQMHHRQIHETGSVLTHSGVIPATVGGAH